MKNIILLLASFFILLSAQEKDDAYQLGQGMQIGSLPIYVGGYFSTDYERNDKVTIYDLDDLAFISYGNYEKFSFMAELEYKELYVKTKVGDRTFTTKDTHLYIERLYIDYTLNENYMIRVGKFNSPIGYWNIVPINVLRDTSSHPITSDILFPMFTTGALLNYTSYNKGEIKIDIALQNNDDLEDDYNNYIVDRHYGIGITYTQNNLSLKFNSGMFEKVPEYFSKKQLYYILLSLEYDSDDFKIMSELGSQKSDNEFTTDYAGYLQGLYRLNEKHNLILRAESFKTTLISTAQHTAIVGYTYRPIYPVAIKAEYQFRSSSRSNKLLLSFSMMF